MPGFHPSFKQPRRAFFITMPYQFFQFLHVTAAILLVASTFSAFANPVPGRRKLLLGLNGTFSLLVLLTGLGMGHIWSWPVWLFAKIVLWLAITAMAGIAFRRRQLTGPLGIATALLTAAAVWLVYYKPW